MKIIIKERLQLRLPLLVGCGQLYLSDSQTAGFFDHKYLWKESILDFCMKLVIQESSISIRRYIENQKARGSNPIRCSVRVWDPTSLRGSQRPSDRTRYKCSDEHPVGEAAHLTVAQSWSLGSQIAVKDSSSCFIFYFLVFLSNIERGPFSCDFFSFRLFHVDQRL